MKTWRCLLLLGRGFLALAVVAPAAAEARTCVATAGACLDTNELEPLAGRVPLVLIHGWNPQSVPSPPLPLVWVNFARFYAADPELQATFKLYAFSYSSNAVALPELAGALRDVLDQASAADPFGFGAKPIVVVAHSLGGLIARGFLTLPQQMGPMAGRSGSDRLLGLITLGTPHHGSVLANGPAAIVRAGPIWGALLQRFNLLFFSAGGPDWSQPNRLDLLWDNFDGLLDYQTFAGEQNPFLTMLNLTSEHDGKLVAYAGVLVPAAPCGLNPFCWGSTVLAGAFGLASDGFVPLTSAHLYSTTGVPRVAVRIFPGYNHSEIAAGRGVQVDPVLFGQIKMDLRAFVAQAPPGPPTNLVSSVTGSTVSLAWNAPATGGAPATYLIEAGSIPGASDLGTFDTGSQATGFVVSGVAAGTYFVRVRAQNRLGTSTPSNEVIVSVEGAGPCLPPSVPTGLSAVVLGANVSLTWNAAAGAVSYVLEAGSAPGAANILMRNVGPATAVAGIAPPGTYFARVRALGACGALSGPSNEVMATIGGSLEYRLSPDAFTR